MSTVSVIITGGTSILLPAIQEVCKSIPGFTSGSDLGDMAQTTRSRRAAWKYSADLGPKLKFYDGVGKVARRSGKKNSRCKTWEDHVCSVFLVSNLVSSHFSWSHSCHLLPYVAIVHQLSVVSAQILAEIVLGSWRLWSVQWCPETQLPNFSDICSLVVQKPYSKWMQNRSQRFPKIYIYMYIHTRVQKSFRMIVRSWGWK